jgi:hypothetical protein
VLCVVDRSCCRTGRDASRPGDREPAAATPPVGETFIPLAAGRVDERVQAKSVTGSWRMRIQTNHATDTLTAQVIHPPGSSSGWHKDAGPVIVTVVEGTPLLLR